MTGEDRPAAPPDDQERDRSSTRARWTLDQRLAVAALVVAVVFGGAALLRDYFNLSYPGSGGADPTSASPAPNPTPSPNPPVTGPSAGPSNDPGSAAPTSTAPTGPAGAVRWSGEVPLPAGGLDLDAVPPAFGDAGADLRKDDFTEIAAGPGARLIEWSGRGEPSFDDCAREVRGAQPGVPIFDAQPGQYLCGATDEARVARVRYLGIGEYGRFGFEITTWETP